MSELPKYECHLCLEAGRKNWKQRCPWALKLAEILIYHRNLNVALDLKLAKSELLQKNIPGLRQSVVTPCSAESPRWNQNLATATPTQSNHQMLHTAFSFPPSHQYFTSQDFLLLQSLLWCFRTTGKFGLEGFHASGSEWVPALSEGFVRMPPLSAGDANPPSQARPSCLRENFNTIICCTEKYFR